MDVVLFLTFVRVTECARNPKRQQMKGVCTTVLVLMPEGGVCVILVCIIQEQPTRLSGDPGTTISRVLYRKFPRSRRVFSLHLCIYV